MSFVAVLDYGMGNLDSVARALEECGAQPQLARRAEDVVGAAAVVLPGVGSFERGMANIRDHGFDQALQRAVAEGVPVLGLCLGMQLLVDNGVEGGRTDGLGLIAGRVQAIAPSGERCVPHIGWNDVDIVRPSPLFAGIESGTDFYFVHGYEVVCDSPHDVVAEVDYAGRMIAGVARGLVFGVQFHPEKSQRAGFALLRNFLHVSGLVPRPETTLQRATH
jgi:glutamine amidotransferase